MLIILNVAFDKLRLTFKTSNISTTIQPATHMLEDKFVRFGKLYFIFFFFALGIPVLITIILASFYGFSKLIAGHVTDNIFELLVLSVPTAVLTSAYAIFYIRTKRHRSLVIQLISWTILGAGLFACVATLTTDLISYCTIRRSDITDYHSFNTLFLAANIVALFFVAVIQAFTTAKEKDWMEKLKEQIGRAS